MERNRSFFSGILRFVFGATIGAILALLYAPRSGKETRDKLKTQADELVEKSKERISAEKERALELVSSGKEAASKQAEELRHKIENTKKRVSERIKK